MRLQNILLALALSATGMVAQEVSLQNKPSGAEQAVLIPVKTLTGADSFRRLSGMLGVFKVNFAVDEKMRTVLVYASPQVIEQIKKVVEELDRPGSDAASGRNIDMTLTFLRCGTKPSTAPSDLPADLESAAKQLRAATPCKSITLWDVIPFRMQEGRRVEQSIRLPGTLPGEPKAMATGELRIMPEAVTQKDSGRYVRFERLNIRLRLPYAVSGGYQNLEVGLDTAGDFKEGQKTILGKLSGAEDEASVFVVVSLKIID